MSGRGHLTVAQRRYKRGFVGRVHDVVLACSGEWESLDDLADANGLTDEERAQVEREFLAELDRRSVGRWR